MNQTLLCLPLLCLLGTSVCHPQTSSLDSLGHKRMLSFAVYMGLFFGTLTIAFGQRT
uniref:Uncharacterized protein n=1 Tax=uncultured marine virus TaxID=186617 RepID=A0A0F7L5S7_9VIRU|nr:hypothetical protein [uncultured marine virus]